MKRFLLSLLLFPSLAWAGPEMTENDLITNPKTGTYVLGRQNEAQTSISATAGDAIAPSYDQYGNVMCRLTAGTASATNPVRLEDSAAVSGDAAIASLLKRLDQLATGEVGSNNDYAVPLVDTLSRQYVNPWGAAVTEFWSQCSSAETGTSARAIRNAVASNRSYVTAISCSNTTAVASTITFHDGSTTYFGDAIPNNTTGGIGRLHLSFPTPLRFGSNAPVNFQLATTATSTICCAAGFTSPY